jgi:Zn-dependent peptidase ImmA (M78 family)
MFYNEQMPLVSAKVLLIEGRYKTTKGQKDQMLKLEKELGVPQSALIRMALDSFLPKIQNNGFTEKGIRAGYLNKGY